MSEDELEVLIRLNGKFYEGKLRPQIVGSKVPEDKTPVFPEPYAEMLLITDRGNSWHVKPRTFLGSANFAEVARIVKQYGGEYISAGKESYFRVQK
jgi:hypothetical protein